MTTDPAGSQQRGASKGRHTLVTPVVLGLLALVPSASARQERRASRTVRAASAAELSEALAAARAGDEIVVADGRYEGNFTVRARGTAEHQITLRAANRGRAEIAGDSRLELVSAAWVTVEGFRFSQRNTLRLTSCHDVRLTRNHFRMQDPPGDDGHHWTLIDGAGSHHNRIDHNLYEEKHALGHFICIDGSRNPALASQHDRIDHNHLRDIGPFGEGMESIRIGFSGMSMSSAFTTVEDNLFERCSGDLEIISVKSCDNQIRRNTVLESEGALVARHGHRNSFISNFILGNGKPNTGGIRVYGDDNRIIGNYIEGLRDLPDQLVGIKIDNGSIDHPPPYTARELVRHFRVHRALVAFNTLVDNEHSLQIGSLDYEAPEDGQDPKDWIRRPLDPKLVPKDSVIANDIVVGSGPRLVYQVTQPEDLRLEGNVMFPMGSAALGIPARPEQILISDPRLIRVEGLWKLSAGSPAVDRAVGRYVDLLEDIDGQPRGGKKDVGADEWSRAPVRRRPLKPADVGVDAR